MPKPCQVCSHSDHATLLAALPHKSLRQLEAQFGISRSVLSRHRTQGCPAMASRPGETDRTGGELERLTQLLEEIRDLLAMQQPRHAVEDDSTGTVAPRWEWNRL